jgi:hypothetical protein
MAGVDGFLERDPSRVHLALLALHVAEIPGRMLRQTAAPGGAHPPQQSRPQARHPARPALLPSF